MADDRSAVLLIRVWLEGEEEAFRARLTTIGLPSDGASGEETSVAFASPRDVVTAVEEWVQGFVRGSETTSGN